MTLAPNMFAEIDYNYSSVYSSQSIFDVAVNATTDVGNDWATVSKL